MGANKRALSARWQGAALLVILGIATSWLVNPVAADAVCSEEEGPLSCEACREGADVNVSARVWIGVVNTHARNLTRAREFGLCVLTHRCVLCRLCPDFLA